MTEAAIEIADLHFAYGERLVSVSYTHLDVYKRQLEYQTVSRKRMLRVNAGMCTLEDVPLSADGLDELILEAFV